MDTPKFYWTTRDGQRLQPKDMETSHIKNCIKMLESQIIDPWAVHGDEPKYGAGGYMDSVLNENNEKLERSIKIFEEELNSRELFKGKE